MCEGSWDNPERIARAGRDVHQKKGVAALNKRERIAEEGGR
jgi:hypothetical protein